MAAHLHGNAARGSLNQAIKRRQAPTKPPDTSVRGRGGFSFQPFRSFWPLLPDTGISMNPIQLDLLNPFDKVKHIVNKYPVPTVSQAE